jgi:peptidoglycan/xylan/chitin deacetylase (PgdA/CDA1 family)
MGSWMKIGIFLAVFAIAGMVIWQVDHVKISSARNNLPTPTQPRKLPKIDVLQEQAEMQIAPEKENPQQLSVPILMYHHISPLTSDADQITTNLTVEPEKFDFQVSWLKSHGYQTLTLTQLNQVFFGKRNLPEKPIILTFDDGYADNFEYAFPVLKKYGMTGVFFVITGSRGGWYMSWEQIRKLAKAGMEIGSHTKSHPDLTQLSASALADELSGSKDELERELGIKSMFLSYPAGKYNDSVIEEARSLGYLGAVTTEWGSQVKSQRIFEIPRLRVNHDTSIEGLLE